ncbi:hypothetical protein JHS3_22920 [Jeongeupia sp. HS-3]|uniref:hypothetical protein n=1 Tax=Jeongeupia sp. HS-3 TaxID=1009682 RepID=UPI0018A60A96|nr:hypothetical protein [Jeongeupia sp. HS-3]BCL76556.1 hypothetical protein JHS3_22920 [Jeongeupia sp. HS-3]
MSSLSRHLGPAFAPLLGIAIAAALAIGLLTVVRDHLLAKPVLQDAAITLSNGQLASAADWIAANRGTAYKQEAGKPWTLSDNS